MVGVGRAGFLNDIVGAIDLIMPRTAVPVVVAGKVQYPGALHIERHVEIVGELVEEVGSIGSLVSARPVIGAAHIRPGTDPLIGPALPHAVSVESDGDYGRLGCGRQGSQKKRHSGKLHPFGHTSKHWAESTPTGQMVSTVSIRIPVHGVE